MLFGRDDLVRRLAASESRVTLLVADSGVGKTAVLQATAMSTRASGGIAPALVEVGWAPGSLQAAMLKSLGLALSEAVLDEDLARRYGRVLIEAAGRVADAHLSDAMKAVGRHLLGVVRVHVGDTVADLLSELAQQLTTARDEELANRIRTASDPDVVYALATLAGAVSGEAGEPILLTLDNLERLKEDDLGRLADLVDLLPDTVRILAAFQSTDSAKATAVDELEIAGAHVFPMDGLKEFAVRAWISAEGLPENLAPRIHQLTNGYALHVSDAITLIKSGKHFSELFGSDRGNVLRPATRMAWRTLSPQAQVAALQLAPYADPIDHKRAAEYLGMDAANWSAIRVELLEARIFVNPESPWFHQLRRWLLVSEVLERTELALARRRAIAEIAARIDASKNLPGDLLVQYARTVDDTVAAGDAEPPFVAIGQAGREELAILGALMELTDGDSLALDAESVLFHARDVFGATGDLVDALERLVQRGLAVVASNEHSSAVVARWESPAAYKYAAGRVAGSLDRVPLPRLASAMFEWSVRPRLGAFDSVQYGVGAPDFATLSGEAKQLQTRPPGGELRIGQRGPNLLLRIMHGELPLYAAVAYSETSVRDAALSSITDLDEEIAGQRLRTVEAVAQPMEMVPSRRLLDAFERVLGFSIGNHYSISAPAPMVPADQPIEEALSQRRRTAEVFGELSQEAERLALSYESRPRGYVYMTDGRGSETVRAAVVGRDTITELEGQSLPPFRSPLYRFRLAQLAGLGSGERLERLELYWSQAPRTQVPHPVVDEALRLSRRLGVFNQYQDRAHVNFEERTLEVAVQRHLDGCTQDAERIAAALGLQVASPCSDVYLLLDMRESQPGYVLGAMNNAYVYSMNSSGRPRARVKVLRLGDSDPWEVVEHGNQASEWDKQAAVLGAAFGETATPTRGTLTSVLDAVGGALGYLSGEFALVELP